MKTTGYMHYKIHLRCIEHWCQGRADFHIHFSLIHKCSCHGAIMCQNLRTLKITHTFKQIGCTYATLNSSFSPHIVNENDKMRKLQTYIITSANLWFEHFRVFLWSNSLLIEYMMSTQEGHLTMNYYIQVRRCPLRTGRGFREFVIVNVCY